MLKRFARLMLRILFRLRVRGPAPAHSPDRLIVIANHQSFLDGVFIQCHLPFDLTWIVHMQIARQWIFRTLLKLVPHAVVDTTSPLALKTMVHLIESGKPICIFPEGRMTVTGSLMKVYDGLAFLAFKTNAELLPVAIDGATHSIYNRLKPPFPRKLRPRVNVTFFPLRKLDTPPGRTGRERRRAASKQVRTILENIVFAAQPPATLFDAFLDAIKLYGRNYPVLDDIRFQPQTYGQVLRGSLALGRLASRLAAEGETVGVLMPNAAPTVMLLFGLFAYRRVPAMLNYTSGVDGMQNGCNVAKIRTVIASRAFLERAKLTEKVAQLQGVRVVLLEDLRSRFSLLDKAWLLLWALRFPRRVMLPSRPGDPAVVLFTSGSEGKPKGVVLSHASILANVSQARAVFEFSNRDKFLTALPLFHSFGLTIGTLVPLVTGARLFLYPSPLHYRMIPEMCYDQDCTILFGTGTFLANYAKYAHEYDFYSVRYVLSGAEKLQESVRRLWMEKFGIRILEGYGVTEMSPAIAVNTPMFNKGGTVGRLLPGIESYIEPVEGIERGGLLHVRGPNLMLGYLLHDRPGELRPPSSIRGPGWYNTGDVADFDDDGFMRLLARMKRFAKVAGEMVSLEVVEQIAMTASPSKAHAATTVMNLKRGETIVVFTEDRDLRREHLVAAARDGGLPDIAVPRALVQVDKLPRLGSGKVDYLTLKQMAEERVPAGS
jgi:acyl-[acyl-carrier-protein]-phospholipid O-acyltransferase/long-chain-fatty-acid--[acyl-carrier-protein] ligase